MVKNKHNLAQVDALLKGEDRSSVSSMPIRRDKVLDRPRANASRISIDAYTTMLRCIVTIYYACLQYYMQLLYICQNYCVIISYP